MVSDKPRFKFHQAHNIKLEKKIVCCERCNGESCMHMIFERPRQLDVNLFHNGRIILCSIRIESVNILCLC